MNYIVGLRVGQNDIKALTTLENERRIRVKPLLSMRGNTSRDLDKFILNWEEKTFFLDVSHYPGDADSEFNASKDLHNPSGNFSARQAFYSTVKTKSPGMIPVVSWADDDPARDVVQLALALSRQYDHIAIRPTILMTGASPQFQIAQEVLNAVPDPTRVWLLPDMGFFDANQQALALRKANSIINKVSGLNLAGVSFLTTSYPTTKPASGTAVTIPCLDIGLFLSIKRANSTAPLVYADCGATNPTAAMEFVPGMPIIPFAAYLTSREWWMGRLGVSHESSKFVDLAQTIRLLPGYHGDDFCWGTKEIARIASGTSTTGSNGSWNGIRINQHIAAILDHMDNGGFDATSSSSEEEEL